MARPTDVAPFWATGPTAPIAEPDDAIKAKGWVFRIKPPDGIVNWWWNLIYQWTAHFSETVAVYTDLEVASDDATLVAGEGMCIVWEDDSTTGPAAELVEVDRGGALTGVGGIDACGNLVVFSAGTADVTAKDRDLADVAGATYTRSNAGTNRQIATNGTFTIQAYDEFVECFNATTGASIWVHDNDVTVNDIELCGAFVYLCSGLTAGTGDSTANRHLHKLQLSDGVVQWSYRHSAAQVLRNVCSDGLHVFINGDASTFASLATIRALNADDGKDATGTETDSNGIDTAGRAWNDIEATASTASGVMDCNLTSLYTGFGAGAAGQLTIRSLGTGATFANIANPDPNMDVVHVSVDQDYVYVCTNDGAGPDNGWVEAYSKIGALVWKWANLAGGIPNACTAATSDGHAVYAIGNDLTKVWKITRGNRPLHMRKKASSEISVLRNWIMQPTGHKV